MSNYHEAVLLKDSVDYLITNPKGIYIDATFGGGGHSNHILNQLDQDGRLIAFDQDQDAWQHAPNDSRFKLITHNFRYLKRFLRLEGITQIDGVLGDLGVSSHQLNTAERGFSYRFDSLLDMRMSQAAPLTAKELINTYEAEALCKVFGQYGEVRNARTLANTIVKERSYGPINTTGDLLRIIEPVIRGKRNKYLSQVFQALRIEVNDEITALQSFLTESMELLKVGGRLVIISYHSLEDRLVKNLLKKGNFEGEVIKDFYGNIYRPFKEISRKAISASEFEIKNNPRARSARMRVGEKK